MWEALLDRKTSRRSSRVLPDRCEAPKVESILRCMVQFRTSRIVKIADNEVGWDLQVTGGHLVESIGSDSSPSCRWE